MENIPQETFNKKRVSLIWKLSIGIIVLAFLGWYGLNSSHPGKSAIGCLSGCSSADARKPGPLRVLSLNMLHGFPLFKNLQRRLDLISAEARRMDVDVLLLQEVPWTIQTGSGAECLAKELGYNYLYYRANGNRGLIFFEEGEAILSRFPLKDPIVTELQPRVGWFENRVGLGATAFTPWGQVTFFVTHLTDKSSDIASGQADSLKKFVDERIRGPTVISGDFNSSPNSPQIEDLSHVWLDAYQVMHPDDRGLTCCIDDLNNGPDESLEERIDYIFLVPQSAKLVSAERAYNQPFAVPGGWQWASDHVGLMIEIEP